MNVDKSKSRGINTRMTQERYDRIRKAVQEQKAVRESAAPQRNELISFETTDALVEASKKDQ